MSPSYIHASNPSLAVAAVGGSNYWLQAVWGTDPGVLTEPPAVPRTAANYLESPELWVGAMPTAAAPAIIRAEPTWWQAARGRERTLWCRVSWRGKPADPWVFKASVEFVVNHEPDAVLVPEQVVALDGAGAVIADVVLDGSGSSDPDRAAPTNPAGPLAFRWANVAAPPGMAAAGAVAQAAAGLPATAAPTWLAAGTPVPAGDRGPYTFRLTVDDQERATIGAKAGQSRSATADQRVFVGTPTGPGVSLVAPSASELHSGNFEDGVDVLIAYRVDPALTAQAAYAGGWRLQCTITQARESPVAFSSPVGTKVFETTTVPRPGQLELIRWDGREPAAAGLPCVGAFDVRLELLDAAGAATGAAGAVTTAAECIVLDYVRWLLPVNCATSQAVLAGGFMESGHGGFGGGGLHGGMDIARVGQPDVRAARSGRYTALGGAVNTLRMDHAAPDRTLYLHGDALEPHANGDLVLQGERLARMADVGAAGAIHLHFEHHTLEPGVVLRNPQAIVPMWDAFRPVVDAVYVRQAGAAGAAADLGAANAGIVGAADLIVRCRDRAHPGRDTPVDNGPYGLTVTEKPAAVAAWPQLRFDRFDAANQLREFYAQQGLAGNAVNDLNHYLPYLRWDTAPYQQRGGPLWIDIAVTDFTGLANAVRSLTLGPEAALAKAPISPATASANPQPFGLEIDVTNRTTWLNDNPADNTSFVSSDNFHIALAGAPPGWTVSPGRSGPVSNGATAARPWGGQPQPQRVALTIDPHGAAAAGAHAFEIVVYSAILEQVGTRVPVTAVVS